MDKSTRVDQRTAPERTLGVAVIGAGEIARRHVDGLLRAGGVRFISVVDRAHERAEELARTCSFARVERSVEALIAADDVDLVVVLTPHDCHAPQVVAALDAGKHVICEKPMARTLDECDAMLAAASRSGRQLFVTHALRSVFFFATAHERVAAGALGRVLLGAFTWYTDELARLEDPAHWKGTVDESGGGVLIDGGCHVADVGNWLFGRARRVHAFARRLVAKRERVGEDTAALHVEYDTGAMASYALSFTAGSAFRAKTFACGMDVDLFGTAGHLEGGYRIRDAEHRHYALEHRSEEHTSELQSL